MSRLPITCPQCLQVKGVLQGNVSDLAHVVDYYKCTDCQYVWTVEKSQQDRPRPPTIVRIS
jgi:transposase-like protein